MQQRKRKRRAGEARSLSVKMVMLIATLALALVPLSGSARAHDWCETVHCPPTLSTANPGVSVEEGQTAHNQGSVSDPDTPPNEVEIWASVGSVVADTRSFCGTIPLADFTTSIPPSLPAETCGSWHWSYTPGDGPATESITIFVRDADGHAKNLTFTLNVEDHDAPTVVKTSPHGQKVPQSAKVKATFSEKMAAGTLTRDTVTLRKGRTVNTVAATVTYRPSTKTVILDPARKLRRGVTYVARVQGGAGGAEDTASNSLAADKVWSFKVER